MADPMMPDLSHLSAEERAIIEQVFQRQKAEEEKETQLSKKAEKDLDDLERQINERKETAARLVGTQDDAICQICQKTKFADGIGHKCFYCQLRSCARCGGKVQGKTKPIWACSLCQKRQQIMAKTGKWFQQGGQQNEEMNLMEQQSCSPTPPASAPRTPQPPHQQPTPHQPLSAAAVTAAVSQQPSASGRSLPSAQHHLPPLQQQKPTASCVAQPTTSTQQRAPPQQQQTTSAQGGHPQLQQQRHPPPGRQPSLSSGSLHDPQLPRQSQQANMHQQDAGSHRRQNTLHRQPSLEAQDSGSMGRDPNGIANGAPPQVRQSPHIPLPLPQHKTSISSPSTTTVISQQQQIDQRSLQRRPQDQQPQQPIPQGYRAGLDATGRQQSRQEFDDRQRRRSSAAVHQQSTTPERSPRESRDERGLYPEQRVHKSSYDYDERDERYDRVPNENYREREAQAAYSDYQSSSEMYDRDGRYDRRRNTNDAGYPQDSYAKHPNNNHRSSSNQSGGRSGELRRTRSRGEADRLDARKFSTPMAPPPAVPPSAHTHLHSTVSGGSHGRPRRNRLHRQLKSMSSSEEEMPSTSDGFSGEDGRIGPASTSTAPEFIEKDILRYIYGSQKARNGKKSASTENARKGASLSASGTLERASSSIMPGDMLAAKIRTYLSHPVTWQPSADQRRMIGHMVLQKTDARNGDLGLKVLGGRRSDTGRLGAFVTRVKPGSVADAVGRLRAGDEVLEWNGKSLQNVTFDQVYNIIQASKNEPRVELIVSRSSHVPGGDDFLNVQRTLPNLEIYEDYLFPPSEPAISHSQSMISPQLHQLFQHNSFLDSPIHKNSMPANFPLYGDAMIYPGPEPQAAKGQIFGRIEISMLFLNAERELVVTVHQAMDLPPRPDGSARNPYVKIFLLPDRSEKSRRQSAVLADTLMPVWNEQFYYHGLTEPMLMTRVLEVTVWDYDKYETNSFLGETLIDFSITQTDNQPLLFTLVDMDEENPIRNRLRQRRISSFGPPPRPRSEMSHYPQHHHHSSNQSLEMSPRVNEDFYGPRRATANYQLPSTMRRSRTYDRNAANVGVGRHQIHHYSTVSGAHSHSHYGNGHSTHLAPAAEEDWSVNNASSGYLSDHAYSSQLPGRYLRRPRSATAMRPLNDSMEMGGGGSRLYGPRHQPQVPQGASGPWNGGAPRHHLPQQPQQQEQNSSPGSGSGSFPHQLGGGQRRPDPRSLNGRLRYEALQEGAAGYGSDGSETLSVNSAQSMSNRMIRGGNGGARGQMGGDEAGSGEMTPGRPVPPGQLVDEYSMDDVVVVSDPGGGVAAKNSVAMKERKKSLMTRLIPGRNAPLEAKRTGFARSEEVGVPEGLSIPADRFQQQHFTKQTSKESTDSSHSDNYMPVLPEGPLGNFLEDLGPGQVVGRQVLASPVLGEIELIISPMQNGLDVEVVRARNLKVKPDIKITPSPYVKIYMMEGKAVVAKAKTQSFPKTTAPQFNQHLLFPEGRGRMLQVTVLGDYGRMERKSFMGVAQIKLDELDFSRGAVSGLYRLYHNSSLVGTGPVRKDSETSLLNQGY